MNKLWKKGAVSFLSVLLILLCGCSAGKGEISSVVPEKPDTSVESYESEPSGSEALSESESEESADLNESEPSESEAQNESETSESNVQNESEVITKEENQMKLMINETEVPVTWEENASVEALRSLLPLTIQMSMYGGFEQVGPIGESIARDDYQTVTNYGDIVLYSGNQIVIFYGSNSWAYTRLGHVDLSEQEMTDLLSNGDVTITIKEE